MAQIMEKPSSLARNRDNQRRARERRQKYIKELEQRSREYGIAGVQATVEVQAAAKKVVDENARLRKLLEIVGVSTEQVGDYLQHGTLPTQGSPSPPVKSTSQDVPRNSESTRSLLDIAHLREELYHARPDHQGFEPQGLPYSVSTQSSIPHAAYQEDIDASYDETSCIDAAHIIASMRGLPDSRQVWPELGCSDGKPCRVSNLKVFQVMDT